MKLMFSVACCCLYSLRIHAQASDIPSEAREGQIVHQNNDNPTATVFTYDRRPLLEAVRLLNGEYGWNINYEEAPTRIPSEIVDDNAGFRLSHPGYREGYAPKGLPFQSTFKETETHQAEEEAVLQQLLRDYNASPNPGRYTLERTAQNGYAVVGTKYDSPSGTAVEFTPLLSCRISLSISSMNLRDALVVVSKKVSDTCKIDLNGDYAGEMLGPSASWNVTGTYDSVAARDVVEDLLSQEQGLLHYSVEYIPVMDQFYLETWLVFRKITGVDGNQILDPVINKKFVDKEAQPQGLKERIEARPGDRGGVLTLNALL